MPATNRPRPNDDQRRRWNDDYWASTWPSRVPLTAQATPLVLDAAALRAGEAVLDIGSGTGETTVAAAQRVGNDGKATGADISTPLVDHARRAAARQSAANCWFVVADVQADPIPGAPYDAAISQFGVMFFDDPIAAFANVRDHVVAGGRLVFACWRSAAENPWHNAHVLGAFAPPAPPPAPGAHPTGPFAFADDVEVAAILDKAGWRDARLDAVDLRVALERDVLLDEGAFAYAGVPEERLDDAREAADAYYARFTRDDGRLEVPLAFWIASAVTPG